MLKRYQKGVSPLGVIFVICVFVFMVTCALKLTPHYLQNATIKGIFKTISEDTPAKDMNINVIKDRLSKEFSLNQITGFSLKDHFYMDKSTGVIGFEYENREKMFGNIDVILLFAEEYELQ